MDSVHPAPSMKPSATASPEISFRTSATTLGLSAACCRKASRAAAGWSSARSNRDFTRCQRSGFTYEPLDKATRAPCAIRG